MKVRAYLVENDIIVNVGIFDSEETAIAHGYSTDSTLEGLDIGDDISDLVALEQRKIEAQVVLTEGELLWDEVQLRRKRNELLAETDYWAFADRTPTAEQIAYRQALRDLPNQVLAREPDEIIEGNDHWRNVIFPVKP